MDVNDQIDISKRISACVNEGESCHGKAKKRFASNKKSGLEHTVTIIDSNEKAQLELPVNVINNNEKAKLEPTVNVINNNENIEPTVNVVNHMEKAELEPTVNVINNNEMAKLEPTVNVVNNNEKAELEPTVNVINNNEMAKLEPTVNVINNNEMAKLEPTVNVINNNEKAELEPTVNVINKNEKAELEPTVSAIINNEKDRNEPLQTICDSDEVAEHEPTVVLTENSLIKHVDRTSTVDFDMYFRCTVCKFTCNSENSLRDHMFLHENYLCHICGQEFMTKHSLTIHTKAHMLDSHDNLKRCDICGDKFPGDISLGLHKRAHQTVSSFRCGECGKIFTRKYNLDGHKLIHEGRQPFTCDTCGEKFAFKSYLENHIRGHVGKSFECNICGKILKAIENLKIHMTIHSNERKFKCMHCALSFKTKNCLNRHTLIHTKTKHFVCKFCNASSRTKYGLKVHMSRHTGNLRYKCKLCDQKFHRRQKFIRHSKCHIAKNVWKCFTCEETFLNKNLLSRHQRNHFKCEFCGQGFTFISGVKEHNKVHISKNSWKCVSCCELFPDMRSLQIHRKICSDYTRTAFKCKFCDSLFSRAHDLTRHNKFHIAENSWKCRKCDDIFVDKNALKIHRKENHRMKFTKQKDGEISRVRDEIQICKICDFKVPKGYHMSSHILLHHARGSFDFVCISCGKGFITKRGLKCHSQQCKFRKACSQKWGHCGFVFKSRLGLLHNKETHKDCLSYQCKKCKRKFKKKLLFDVHVLGHKETHIYKCKKCFAQYNSKIYLSYHSRMHNNVYRCVRCNSRFDTKRLFVTHKDCQKSMKQTKKCLLCLKCFHVNCFSSHIKSHNNLKKKYVCKLCNTRFERKKEMMRHRARKSFKCQLCQKRFHTKYNLKAHKVVHVAKSEWKCKECDKVFLDYRRLVIHYNYNHGILGKKPKGNKDIECAHCNAKEVQRSGSAAATKAGQETNAKETKNKTSLLQTCRCCHCRSNANLLKINIDVSQEVLEPLFCLKCGFEFNFKISLQEHNRRWHLEYSCYICKVEFTSSDNYKKHIESHEFTCDICKIKFKEYLCLFKHLKMHEIGYRCYLCCEKFDEIHDYRVHFVKCMSHGKKCYKKYHKTCLIINDNKNSKIVCTYCLEEFDSKVEIDKHMKESHTKIYKALNAHYCLYCGKSFDDLCKMKLHNKTHESENKCIHFKTEFSSLEEWENTRSFFGKEQVAAMRCRLCNELIYSNLNPDYCFLVEITEKVHSCMRCEKCFLQEKKLGEHYILHKSKQDSLKPPDKKAIEGVKTIQHSSKNVRQSKRKNCSKAKTSLTEMEVEKQCKKDTLCPRNKISKIVSPGEKKISSDLSQVTVNIQNILQESRHTQNNISIISDNQIGAAVNIPYLHTDENDHNIAAQEEVGLPLSQSGASKFKRGKPNDVPFGSCNLLSKTALMLIRVSSFNEEKRKKCRKPVNFIKGNDSFNRLQEIPLNSVSTEAQNVSNHNMIQNIIQLPLNTNKHSVENMHCSSIEQSLSDEAYVANFDLDKIRSAIRNDHTYTYIQSLTQVFGPEIMSSKTEEEIKDECIGMNQARTHATVSDCSPFSFTGLAHSYDPTYDLDDGKFNVFNDTGVITSESPSI